MDSIFIVLLVVLVVAAVAYWWFFMKRKAKVGGGEGQVKMPQDSNMGSQDVDRTGDTVVSTAPEVSSDMGGEKSEDDTPAEVEDDMLKEDSE